MKISSTRLALCVPLFVFLISIIASAQTTTKPSTTAIESDQVLKDILTEVRQMRAEMQRANIYSHRSQVLLERIKVEMDQIARFTRDVADVHDQIEAVRPQLARKQMEVDLAIKMKNAGAIGEPQMNALNSQLEELRQREQNLLSREAMTSAELDISKANLDDLNKRMDALDREISQPTNSSGGQPAKKTP